MNDNLENADDFINFLIQTYLPKEEFKIEKEEENKNLKYIVYVKKRSLGKIVGKGGKVAEAIREIVKSLPNVKKRIYIKFEEMKNK